MNKFTRYILFGSILILLISCAHRSGHKRRFNSGAVNTENSLQPSESASQASGQLPVAGKSDVSHSHSKMDGAEIFRRYNQAVFMVFSSDGKMEYQGSGFFINSNGLAVSNYHVFEPALSGQIAIKLSGYKNAYEVSQIYSYDEKHDWILFQVKVKQTAYIPLADNKPEVGETVYAIGSPLGLENSFTSGEISAWRDDYLIQTSVSIDHGSSGGALINAWGEAVAITSGTFAEDSQANLNYAWSIEAVKPHIK